MSVKKKPKILLEPIDVRPSGEKMKVTAVTNPGALMVDGEICLLIQVDETIIETNKGFVPSLRYDFSGVGPQLITEWIPEKDSRAISESGTISHLRLIKLDKTGTRAAHIDEVPAFFPDCEFEELGIEAPRLVKIRDHYYFTYRAKSRDMASVSALASTGDFCTYQREGIILTGEKTDAAILSEKTQGRYMAIYSTGGNTFSLTGAFSKNLNHWGEHRLLMARRPDSWDCHRLQPGTAPVLTDRGWLEIYHSIEENKKKPGKSICRAGAALFDAEDPSRLIARSKEPLTESPMGTSLKQNIPCSALIDEEKKNLLLFVASEDSIALMKLPLKDLLEGLEPAE